MICINILSDFKPWILNPFPGSRCAPNRDAHSLLGRHCRLWPGVTSLLLVVAELAGGGAGE